jgi:outer membrane protein insertion porin family
MDRDIVIMSFANILLIVARRFIVPVLAVIVITIGSAGSGHAESVVVKGNSRIDVTTIQSYVTGQSPETAKADLLATGLFSSVDVVKNGDTVVVTVKENNIINRVAFEGTKRLKSEVFEGELQLKPRGAFTQAALEADIARIKEIYQRVGRSSVEVKSRTVQLENGRIDVVFTVDEGKKTGVKSIDFVGNASFSSSRLRDEMQTTEGNWLSWIKTTDVYDADRIAADTELVRRFYLKHGYAEMRVADTKVDYDANAAGYRIVITVDEGKQYKVGSVDVESKIEVILEQNLASDIKDFLLFKVTSKPQTGTPSLTGKYEDYRIITWREETSLDIFNKVLGYPFVESGVFCYFEYQQKKIYIKKVFISNPSKIKTQQEIAIKGLFVYFKTKDSSVRSRLFIDIGLKNSIYLLIQLLLH